jgi:hypothetical protein
MLAQRPAIAVRASRKRYGAVSELHPYLESVA